MTETNHLKTQNKIRDLIAKSPGLYLSKIAEMLNISVTEVELCLSEMVKKGELTLKQENGFTTYHIKRLHSTHEDRRTTETRKKIYDIVAKHPGLHLSKIAELIDMRPSHAEYHLVYLEKNNHIFGIREKGYFKRFYVKGSEVGVDDKKLLSLLRQTTPLRIVILLLKSNKILQHKDIAKKLNLNPSTLSYHFKKLIDINIVDVSYYGKEKGYALKNKTMVKNILNKYNINIEVHVAAEDFKDIWKDFNFEHE